jgi:hypothetical protein
MGLFKSQLKNLQFIYFTIVLLQIQNLYKY